MINFLKISQKPQRKNIYFLASHAKLKTIIYDLANAELKNFHIKILFCIPIATRTRMKEKNTQT
jgi:hypothetical protein